VHRPILKGQRNDDIYIYIYISLHLRILKVLGGALPRPHSSWQRF